MIIVSRSPNAFITYSSLYMQRPLHQCILCEYLPSLLSMKPLAQAWLRQRRDCVPTSKLIHQAPSFSCLPTRISLRVLTSSYILRCKSSRSMSMSRSCDGWGRVLLSFDFLRQALLIRCFKDGDFAGAGGWGHRCSLEIVGEAPTAPFVQNPIVPSCKSDPGWSGSSAVCLGLCAPWALPKS